MQKIDFIFYKNKIKNGLLQKMDVIKEIIKFIDNYYNIPGCGKKIFDEVMFPIIEPILKQEHKRKLFKHPDHWKATDYDLALRRLIVEIPTFDIYHLDRFWKARPWDLDAPALWCPSCNQWVTYNFQMDPNFLSSGLIQINQAGRERYLCPLVNKKRNEICYTILEQETPHSSWVETWTKYRH
jgi:hypothetical protein